MMFKRTPSALALAILACALPVLAVSTNFSQFTPLTSSAPPLPIDGPAEATPITLSGVKFSQRTLADRRTQNDLVSNSNSGEWDMITSNETGPNAGRFLFMPFETDEAGVQRVDLQDPHYRTRTVTIVAPGIDGFLSGDASRWAPWGGYLTAEEEWGEGVNGRLFEVTNPLTAGLYGGDFVWRDIVPRVAHEGLAFDRHHNLYFVDELNGGAIYVYVPQDPNATSGDEYSRPARRFVLKVGAGGQLEGNNGPAITGAGTWVPITTETGAPIAGVSTVLPDGTIDGRLDGRRPGPSSPPATTVQRTWSFRRSPTARSCRDLATTDSDIDGDTSNGRSRVYTLNLSTGSVTLFASAESTDLATGAAAGGAFRNADNLAIDAEGNIYIVEDRAGGVDDDIWFARDLNKDGDLLDPGEGIGRWASNGTQGSEFTGLYFDIRNPTRAYVNIQHPSSGVDRLIEISATPSLQAGQKP